MRERGVQLTEKQLAFLNELSRLTGQPVSALIRSAVCNLHELVASMQWTHRENAGKEINAELSDIDKDFERNYNPRQR